MNSLPISKPLEKRAIVSLAIGAEAQKIAALTHPIMEAYARRAGSDFVAITNAKISAGHHKFEKFQLYDLLALYDRICYLDVDILIMPGSPSLFEVVPPESFGAFFDSEVVGNDADIPVWRTEEIEYFQKTVGDIGWRHQYFNTGVLTVAKKHREIFSYKGTLQAGKRFVDQTLINYNFQMARCASFDFGPKFNYFVALNRSERQMTGRFDGNWFLHYAGFSQFYPELSLFDKIQSDVTAVYRS